MQEVEKHLSVAHYVHTLASYDDFIFFPLYPVGTVRLSHSSLLLLELSCSYLESHTDGSVFETSVAF